MGEGGLLRPATFQKGRKQEERGALEVSPWGLKEKAFHLEFEGPRFTSFAPAWNVEEPSRPSFVG